jgi:hypothetical protein
MDEKTRARCAGADDDKWWELYTLTTDAWLRRRKMAPEWCAAATAAYAHGVAEGVASLGVAAWRERLVEKGQ